MITKVLFLLLQLLYCTIETATVSAFHIPYTKDVLYRSKQKSPSNGFGNNGGNKPRQLHKLDLTRIVSRIVHLDVLLSPSRSYDSGDHQRQSWKVPDHWKFLGIRRKSSNKDAHRNKVTTCNAVASTDNSETFNKCRIKVVGVGGGGCNAVDRMLNSGVDGVEFWAINTDSQALERSKSKGANVFTIGTQNTRGLGAGGNPAVGRAAAEESREDLYNILSDTDLCFVTAGMGGGTGSGAAPVVAEIAREVGCLTVGIVTKPFAFEGKRRMNQAIEAIEGLRRHVDTVIVVSNDRLLEIIPKETPLEQAFAVADDLLRQGVVGISDIIVKPGLINVDFADVKAVMSSSQGSTALMGIGVGTGNNAATDAAISALSSPLLDSYITNANGVVFTISGGTSLTLNDVNKAAQLIYETVEPDANVIFGALVDESMNDTISITVLATGYQDQQSPFLKENKIETDPIIAPMISIDYPTVEEVDLSRIKALYPTKSTQNKAESWSNSTYSPTEFSRMTALAAEASPSNPARDSKYNGILPSFMRILRREK